MIPDMEINPEEPKSQSELEHKHAQELVAMRARLRALGAPGVASAPDDRGAMLRLLVPAQYVDVQTLMRIQNTRVRQGIIDALYRGATLHYRR